MSFCVSSRLSTLPLFGSLLLAACNASKPDRGDTLSGSASPVGDTVGAPANSLPPALTKYLDSGGFNPDGYYMIRALTIDGRKIGSLELSTVELADSTGKLRERPILLQPPVGFLTVSEPNSASESRHPCLVRVVTPDSLSVRCVATPVGEVAINGHFLDKGDFSDKFAETSTVLLVGRVVITNGDKTTHDAVHRFSYYTGD
jgi:hypothetical protein